MPSILEERSSREGDHWTSTKDMNPGGMMLLDLAPIRRDPKGIFGSNLSIFCGEDDATSLLVRSELAWYPDHVAARKHQGKPTAVMVRDRALETAKETHRISHDDAPLEFEPLPNGRQPRGKRFRLRHVDIVRSFKEYVPDLEERLRENQLAQWVDPIGFLRTSEMAIGDRLALAELTVHRGRLPLELGPSHDRAFGEQLREVGQKYNIPQAERRFKPMIDELVEEWRNAITEASRSFE